MSYTRSYYNSISVSGYTTVSYPASEHGGTMTVTYEQNVPVTIDVTVATEPFDYSIDSASVHVDGLTASVAAMNTANCAAIAQSADRVSNSLISGFYNLIQSDISTKKTESHTAIQAKSALLLEHSKAVQDKHDRMLSDVERERAKYGKVFRDLDKELERRVTEINKPAFRLSRNVREEVVVRPYLSQAAATAYQLGAKSGGSGCVAAAGLLQKVSAVLQNLSRSLRNNLMYRHMMRDILWDKSGDKEQRSYIPVAYFVFEDIENANRVYRCYTSDNPNKNAVLARVDSYIEERKDLEAGTIPDDEMKLIDQAFSSMVQDSYSSLSEHNEYQERVYTEICRLWKDGGSKIKQV